MKAWGRARTIILSCSLVLFSLFAFSAVLVVYMIKCSTRRPLYSAQRQQEHTENRSKLIHDFGAQPVVFQTDDAITLAGLLLMRPEASHTLLLCHGYRMSKERMYIFAQLFPDKNIFMFDYRGHGESAGQWTSIGYHEKKDVLAAIKFLQNHEQLKKLPIIGLGVSMGAVSLCAAAAECPIFKALIFDSPFAQLEKQAQRVLKKRYKLPSFPFEKLGRLLFSYLMHFSLNEVNTLAWIQNIKVPILIIHSKQDDTASFDDAQVLYQHVNAVTKDFWVVDGSGHARIFADYPQEYRDKVQDFFARIL